MSEDTSKTTPGNESQRDSAAQDRPQEKREESVRKKEIGGRGGLDPTRYGDWEKDGRCIDF
jgi:hypothetical protein